MNTFKVVPFIADEPRSNKAVNADAQVRPLPLVALILVRRLPLR
jgi:hypothetical protein